MIISLLLLLLLLSLLEKLIGLGACRIAPGGIDTIRTGAYIMQLSHLVVILDCCSMYIAGLKPGRVIRVKQVTFEQVNQV